MARQSVNEIRHGLLKDQIGCRRTGNTVRNTIPILDKRILIVGVMVVVLLIVAMSATRKFEQFRDGIRKARENEKIDNRHLWTGNGGLRPEASVRGKAQTRIEELEKNGELWITPDELQ